MFFSLDLKTNSDSLPVTVAGNKLQTDGTAYRKKRFAKSVRANGWVSSELADESSVSAFIFHSTYIFCVYRFYYHSHYVSFFFSINI